MLGHRVTVFSGPPYPDLDPGVFFEAVPSLDLYAAPGWYETKAWRKIRTRTDVREFWEMLVMKDALPVHPTVAEFFPTILGKLKPLGG